MSVHFHEPDNGPIKPAATCTITVHLQETTKRPVGYAPWPKPKPKHPKKPRR
jgi:hypothetical protein